MVNMTLECRIVQVIKFRRIGIKEDVILYYYTKIECIPPKDTTILLFGYEWEIENVIYDINKNRVYLMLYDVPYGVQEGRTVKEILEAEYSKWTQEDKWGYSI